MVDTIDNEYECCLNLPNFEKSTLHIAKFVIKYEVTLDFGWIPSQNTIC